MPDRDSEPTYTAGCVQHLALRAYRRAASVRGRSWHVRRGRDAAASRARSRPDGRPPGCVGFGQGIDLRGNGLPRCGRPRRCVPRPRVVCRLRLDGDRGMFGLGRQPGGVGDPLLPAPPAGSCQSFRLRSSERADGAVGPLSRPSGDPRRRLRWPWSHPVVDGLQAVLMARLRQAGLATAKQPAGSVSCAPIWLLSFVLPASFFLSWAPPLPPRPEVEGKSSPPHTWQAEPTGIAPGPHANLWLTEDFSNKIGRITNIRVVTGSPDRGRCTPLIAFGIPRSTRPGRWGPFVPVAGSRRAGASRSGGPQVRPGIRSSRGDT